MEIKFYNNKSDNRCIRKELLNEYSLSGNLRDACSLLEPVLNIESSNVIRFNYAYIPDFQRYYFIKKITSIRNGVWELELEVDPLMSFKGDILALQVVVEKQASSAIGDEYIDDGSLVTSSETFTTVYNFSKGFNNNPEYILITAG